MGNYDSLEELRRSEQRAQPYLDRKIVVAAKKRLTSGHSKDCSALKRGSCNCGHEELYAALRYAGEL